jgi:alcohol dehydrogenase, propanol-preferring
MKAARIVKVNEPLQIQEIQTPKPKGAQVLVKVQSAGVCHSDVHGWEEYYEGIDGQKLTTAERGVKYPLTPGHEIAGTVESLGEQAEGFTKNEKVVVYPWVFLYCHNGAIMFSGITADCPTGAVVRQ